MMVTRPFAQLRRLASSGHRARNRRAADPDAAPLRRVGWHLAGLTVSLIGALLIVLGVAVYLSTQSFLLRTLQQTVLQRIAVVTHQSTASNGHVPAFLGDVRFVIADRTMTVIRGTDPYVPSTLPDPSAARQALQGHLATPWSTQQVDTLGPYLIYTLPVQLVQPNGTTSPGVLQAFVSEHQYQSGLQTLLDVLVGVSVLGLLAATAISAVLVRRALRPIQLSLRRQRDFVADAAHELRTPLTIQRAAGELGLAAGTIDELHGAVEQGLAQNAHLTRLVDALSLLARADSGAVTLERDPVDLTRLVTETVSGVAILAEERGVRLDVRAGPSMGVCGDAGRLRQLLLILLDNALRYTPDGGSITVSLTRQGRHVQLRVRDSGPGIAAADLQRIFERFYRADKARTGGGGTGLGLAIGRWIVDAHDGQIAAANAASGGAVFTVTLPLTPSTTPPRPPGTRHPAPGETVTES